MTSRKCAGYFHQFARCTIVPLMTFFLVFAGAANAANLTLAWDANSEPSLTGYRVFCGESSGNYTVSREITSDNLNDPPPTTCEFTGLKEGKKYYFAAMAVSDTGQSDYSQEISYTIPAAQDPDGDGDGVTEADGDCDDTDASVFPGATEICGDGIDQDCDGNDLACPDPDKDSDNDGLTDNEEMNIYHTDPNNADSDGDGYSDGEEVAGGFDPLDGKSTPVDAAWHSASDFSAVHELGTGNSGLVEMQFDATPFINRLDGVIGYAESSVGITGYSSMAMLVRMNVNGVFDVRNGSGYQADEQVAYSANCTYHVRIESDLIAGTYDAWVTPPGGSEIQIANDYNFRSDAPPTDDIGKVCLIDSIGEFTIENHTVAPITLPADPSDSDDDGDGYSENQGDCNDDNAAVHPGAEDICGDGIDQDCDGSDLACIDYTTDSDNDGLTNYEEENVYLTNPLEADSDGDGVSDGEEIATGSDPNYAEPKSDTSTSEISLEFGEVEVDHNWKTVTLNRIFDDPVVIASALSYEGSDPAVIRVKNVKRDSFEVRVQEWDYRDGNHLNEKVNYIVIESGEHYLADGSHLKAGHFNADAVSSFEAVKFVGQAFNSVPVVLSTISSSNEIDAVVVRLKNITTTGFYYRIQEQESNAKNHITETAGYIAWEPSVGSMAGFRFEVGRTSNSVTHKFQALSFYAPFSSPPIFVAGMQTTDGGDTAAVRWQNRSARGIEIKVEEEQSKDTETNHTTEVIGYMVFEAENSTPGDTQPTNDLVREAEDFNPPGDGNFDFGYDSAASGGEYAHFPNGTGTRFNGPDESQKLNYSFYIATEGTYRIKGAVHAANGNDDSFWIKFTDDKQTSVYLWDVLQNTGYQQDYVNDRNGADPVALYLQPGEKTVTVYLREDGTRLDRIELELVE